MRKFFKGALACAAIIPCMVGMVGCKEKKDETEEAYNTVFAEVSNLTSKFSEIETVGTEFQLNIDIAFDYNQVTEGVPSAENSMSAKVKAVLGARHSQTNKEVFGNIGVVDSEDTFTSIMSAYLVDDIGEDEYALLDYVTADNWGIIKSQCALYTKEGDTYTVAGAEFDANETYYMATNDMIHIYMNSNISALGPDITERLTQILPLEDGKVYGSIYTGEDLIEDDANDDLPATSPDFGIQEMLDEIEDMNYAEFKDAMAESGMSLSSEKNEKGDVALIMTAQGTSIKFIVKADGGLSFVVNVSDAEMGAEMNLIADIYLTEEVEDEYIISDLDSYEDAMDLNTWIGQLMGGLS